MVIVPHVQVRKLQEIEDRREGQEIMYSAPAKRMNLACKYRRLLRVSYHADCVEVRAYRKYEHIACSHVPFAYSISDCQRSETVGRCSQYLDIPKSRGSFALLPNCCAYNVILLCLIDV